MIISHKHKFIFFRPTKVAGTSIELALSEHCGPKDISSGIKNLDTSFDEKQYSHTPLNEDGVYEHMFPEEIKSIIPEKVWKNYTKITIQRNPWDMVVSRWFWQRHRAKDTYDGENIALRDKVKQYIKKGPVTPQRVLRTVRHMNIKYNMDRALSNNDFESFVRHFPYYWTNDNYYFSKNGEIYFDVSLRFENLQEDYNSLCSQLGVESKTLPRAKTKPRKDRSHYSAHYNESTKAEIENTFKKQIKFFGYEFENKYVIQTTLNTRHNLSLSFLLEG